LTKRELLDKIKDVPMDAVILKGDTEGDTTYHSELGYIRLASATKVRHFYDVSGTFLRDEGHKANAIIL
jgi:hypothetical protein